LTLQEYLLKEGCRQRCKILGHQHSTTFGHIRWAKEKETREFMVKDLRKRFRGIFKTDF
jgi:hypothetical protein